MLLSARPCRVGRLARAGPARRKSRILHRRGRPQRTPAAALRDARRALAAAGDGRDVDPRYLDLLIAYEDKRFRQHHGVDPLAVVRAALQLAVNGRIVSGGSTLTMQVARLLEPRTERPASPSCVRRCARSSSSACSPRTRSSRSISASRPTAAISKACARLRSPISARSRGGCRSARPRCWWRCRNRPKCAGPTVRSPPRAPPATACSTGRGAGRIRLTRSRRPRPSPGAGGAPADADAGAACRRSGGRGRAGPEGPSPHHRRHAAEAARRPRARAGACARAGHLGCHHRDRSCDRRSARARRLAPTISTSAAPARST